MTCKISQIVVLGRFKKPNNNPKSSRDLSEDPICLSRTTLAPRQIEYSHKLLDTSDKIDNLLTGMPHNFLETSMRSLNTNTNMDNDERDSEDSENEQAESRQNKNKIPKAGTSQSTGQNEINATKEEQQVVEDIILQDVENFSENLEDNLTDEGKRKLKFMRNLILGGNSDRRSTSESAVRRGLAAEQPSSLIPNFSGKAFVWAERVESIIKARGIHDLSMPIVGQTFLPVVLAKLPPDIARDAPIENLESVLNYLKGIDR